jgi:hypothetical protein
LYASVRKLGPDGALATAELQEYVPKSNWQRYFGDLVEGEDQQLEKQWKELYELRCKVAHNALFERADYDRVRVLADDLCEKLESAVAKLPQVVVPEEEREVVAEEAATRLDPIIGAYYRAWMRLETAAMVRAEREGLQVTKGYLGDVPLHPIVRAFARLGVLSDAQSASYEELRRLRAKALDPTVRFTEEGYRFMTADVLALVEALERGATGEMEQRREPDAARTDDLSAPDPATVGRDEDGAKRVL